MLTTAQLDSLRLAIGGASLLIEASPPGAITISFNRPHKKNALDLAIHDAICRLCGLLTPMTSVRAVFLRGVGNTFTAGADLTDGRGLEPDATVPRMAAMYRALSQLPQFTVALVHGPAVGGGVGLTALCDQAIATVSSYFCCAEVKVGLIPAVISPYILAAIGPRRARQMFMTGRRITAEQALAMGLVDQVVSDGVELEAAAAHIANQLLQVAPGAMREAKLLNDFLGRGMDDTLVDDCVRRTTQRMSSDECREGLRAMRQKRRPEWDVLP